MIITKTPYRISFFGGGSDYPDWYIKNGGIVLSTTIDKYIYLSCRKLPPFFKHKHRIVWSKVELVNKIKDIQHRAVKKILEHYKIDEGIELHYDGDLPARSGMGSSSSFVVGLINTLNCLNSKKINKKELALRSIKFEQKILKDTVGSQDQIAASYGGFNKITFLPKGDFKVSSIKMTKNNTRNLNRNLILLYTGVQRTAHSIASSYANKLKNEKSEEILKILEIAKQAEILLRNNDHDEFGKLLHKTWLIKKELSQKVTNNYLNDVYKDAIKRGALGGKLLGAGGGGFFLFYVPRKKQKKFIRHFNKFVNIPFNFETLGSRIIFNQKN
jgi:D-glycero-alpha-D-manno-heptose-7-phosphate kinase